MTDFTREQAIERAAEILDTDMAAAYDRISAAERREGYINNAEILEAWANECRAIAAKLRERE